MAARLRLAKLHLNKPQDFWNNVLWTDQTKVETFGHNAQQHVWRKPNTAYQHKHLTPTVKHGGGGLMIAEKNQDVAMVQSKSRPQPD